MLPPLTALVIDVDLPSRQDVGGVRVTATDILTVSVYRAFAIARGKDVTGLYGSAVDLRRSLSLSPAFTGNAVSFTLAEHSMSTLAGPSVAGDDTERGHVLSLASAHRGHIELVRRNAPAYLAHCVKITQTLGPSMAGSGVFGSVAESFMGSGVTVTSWSDPLALPLRRHPGTLAAVTAAPFGGIGGATDGVVTIMPPRLPSYSSTPNRTTVTVHTGIVTAQAATFIDAFTRSLALVGGTCGTHRRDQAVA